MYSQLTGVLIPCARPLSFKQSISVIERNRAPTGTNRPFRSRFGAVLDARVILNAGGLHFPILLSSPTNSPHRTALSKHASEAAVRRASSCAVCLVIFRRSVVPWRSSASHRLQTSTAPSGLGAARGSRTVRRLVLKRVLSWPAGALPRIG